MRLIETDALPFEFLSQLAERESWRKEIHRPIYHVHKWWAKCLGSVFREILLGGMLPEEGYLSIEFHRAHCFSNVSIFDPFMGSDTTVGEAHKLGMAALGRDINPVAVEAVRTALGPMDQGKLKAAFRELSQGVGEQIRSLYRSKDSKGRPCDVLYSFWVMQVPCLECRKSVDLFSSWIITRNAYPGRKPVVQILCPSCGFLLPSLHGRRSASCPSCGAEFDPGRGLAKGAKATCWPCDRTFLILDAVASGGARPVFRLYGKLVLTRDGVKEYLPAALEDQRIYQDCSAKLREELERGNIQLPTLALEDGDNTRQAISYGFTARRNFFNDRQLLALGWLQGSIARIADEPTRAALLTLFSSVLEFNNLFAPYKGEGTGAIRHMFSHHILKPEQTLIEANVWGTPKGSGSFSNLFWSRLLRASAYRRIPTEIKAGVSGGRQVCAEPFAGVIEDHWPTDGRYSDRAIYLSCGDSTTTELPDRSIDLVATDPPFFDNVHYSELADFFYSRQQLTANPARSHNSTCSPADIQDPEANRFSAKLRGVFRECGRILNYNIFMIFIYHNFSNKRWKSLADAVLGAGFVVVNSHLVKTEMSVVTPKSQAREPIQLNNIMVCRKQGSATLLRSSDTQAIECAREKLGRLRTAGFERSRNDCKVALFG